MSTEIKTLELTVPEGVNLNIEKNKLLVSGPKGQVARDFPQGIEIKAADKKVHISAIDVNAQTRALVGTYRAHLKNMFDGVQKPFVYKLKVCSTHFPITTTVSGSEFLISNFLGEKRARKAKIPPGVTVSVSGEIVTVESVNLELAGMTATRIEQATRISAKDRRVFQDGIYITEKYGKIIGAV